MKVVIASANKGKISELQETLGSFGWTLLPLSIFSPIRIDETGDTFLENAIQKARVVSRHTNLPAIADDSGLEVDYLGGRPGVRSARYSESGEDKHNNIKLLNELFDVPLALRSARFCCALAFLTEPDDPNPITCCASWEGRILKEPSGTNGFGYDPLFYVDTYNCSVAELSEKQKNRISHRAKASALLLKELKRRF